MNNLKVRVKKNDQETFELSKTSLIGKFQMFSFFILFPSNRGFLWSSLVASGLGRHTKV